MEDEPIIEKPTLMERILKQQTFIVESQGLLTNSNTIKDLMQINLDINKRLNIVREAFDQFGSKAEDIAKCFEKLVEVWQNAAKRPSGKL